MLTREIVEHLAPPPGGTVVDLTVGLGGHAALLLEHIGPQGRLVGFDVDAGTLELARERLSGFANVQLVHSNFKRLSEVLEELGIAEVDAVIADLGVSSAQLDDAERGLSFNHDGPLDMRLNRESTTTAADLVNRLSETELADLIYNNGQERMSRRIARAIHAARRDARITRTSQLADIVCRAMGVNPNSRRSKIHPATRTFMALRIATNSEFEVLNDMLLTLPHALRTGGRAAVISFHSLEDGMCKRCFRALAAEGVISLVNKRPITATQEEREKNPRARSAKLRVVEKRDHVACA